MNGKFNYNELQKRVLAIFFASAFLFVVLFGRLAYLQLFSSYKLTAKALDQWTRDLPITAERGIIYDRNGIVLADNRTSYDIYIRPKMVENPGEMAKSLSDILGVSQSTTLEKLQKKGSSEFTLKRGVNEEQMKAVYDLNYDGIYYSVNNERYYPYGSMLSQVLGYVGVDGEGQSGLEQYYNEYMRGVDGQLLTQSDIVGIEVEDSARYYIEGQKGLDITLTIDSKIQQVAENALKEAELTYSPKSASAIVLDPQSGEVLAMASTPSFDLNNPPRDDMEKLLEQSRNILVSDIYEPGSTFKVLTASMNLEEYYNGNPNAFSEEHIFSSAGTRVVDGQVIKCWTSHTNGKHSNENLKLALQNSCNPVFVDIALSLGKETFYDYLDAFGYGKTTGIDFMGEASGMLLNENIAKNCDIARIGFGQTIAVTPIQIASATSAAINGGKLYQPSLLKHIDTKEGKSVYQSSPIVQSTPISEKTSAVMREYLYNVVENGSGKNAKVEGVTIGGKTGTAQKYENGHIASGKYISSFIGFMPVDNPQYLCLVLVDESKGAYYGGVIAAPIGQRIFEGIVNLK